MKFGKNQLDNYKWTANSNYKMAYKSHISNKSIIKLKFEMIEWIFVELDGKYTRKTNKKTQKERKIERKKEE